MCPQCNRDYNAALNIKREGIVHLKAEGLSRLAAIAVPHGDTVRPCESQAGVCEVRSPVSKSREKSRLFS